MVLTKSDLDKFLDEATEILKGIMDPSESKEYIMGLLFLKRLSDQFLFEYSNIDPSDDPEDSDNYDFYVPEEARWDSIRKISEGIGKSIDSALQKIEESNPKKLEGILTPIQFYQPTKLTDEKLSSLVIHFSKSGFNLSEKNLQYPNLIGEAYESLIEKVAEASGKKGGDFYTTNEVVALLVRLLDPDEGMQIYDPVCGSGGFLIDIVKYLEEQKKNSKNISLYGQEVNTGTWTVCKMNLLLHNIDANVIRSNTMSKPIRENGKLKQYDICLGNPIWNQNGKEWEFEMFSKGDPFSRAEFGVSPKGSGDWMWIQHMIASLKSDGRMGVVLDNGALFRGSKEGNIRQAIIEQKDLIEGVIALPSNLFKGTGSPGCLIILNKNKPESLKKKIFFIHAENEYKEGKAQNYLEKKHIDKIVNSYKEKKVQEKFSDLIDFNEIKENDFNLNVSRYVDILPEEEPVDLPETWKEVEKIQEGRKELEGELLNTMKELGVK